MTAIAELQTAPIRSVVLVGLENVGKSALFRNLARARSGDESNFRGSTVDCRRQWLDELQGELVDTPASACEATAQPPALHFTNWRKPTA